MAVQEQAGTLPVPAVGATAVEGERAQETAGRGRLPALDGARGIAILAVMLYHYTFGSGLLTSDDTWLDATVADIFGTGWTGVDLFFVLSGFLITGLLLEAKGTIGYFRHFYMRRALRIWPAYFVVLILLMAVLPLLQPEGDDVAQALAERIVWYATFTINILVSIDGTPSADMQVAGQFWSIAVEEQFYLVWPVIVLLCGRRLLLTVCGAMVIGALVSRLCFRLAEVENGAAFVFTTSRMDGLAIGSLIAVVAKEGTGLQTLRGAAPWVATAAAVLLGALFVTQGDLSPPLGDWVEVLGITGFVLLFGALLVFIVSARGTEFGYRLFVTPWLRTLGKYSFAMYLLHSAVLRVVVWRWPTMTEDVSLYGSLLFGTVVLSAIAGTITFALAWISWRVLEEPFLQAKSLFPYGSEASAQRLSM
jgi:peptidoglycan/LPS O-acetylase OafA/YrhL